MESIFVVQIEVLSARFTHNMSYLTNTNTHHDQQVAARKSKLQELSVEDAESANAVGAILSKNTV
jgi:hypothetical protein